LPSRFAHSCTIVRDAYLHCHGLAGTGKTFLLGYVANELPAAQLVAATGKAAYNLRLRTGREATTIHHALYRLTDRYRDDDGRMVLEFGPKFERSAKGGDVFICDEASMVNREMAHEMLHMGCRIIAAGDPGQLPPVRGRAVLC
jgi:ATP-dependent exoDNAse (exonuclease V) alpha subunit